MKAGGPGKARGPGPLRFEPLVARAVETVLALGRVACFSGEHWKLPRAAIPNDRPVLLYGNHASNWDAFLYRELHRKLRPGTPTFSLMLEHELARRPLLRRVGGMGLRQGSGASLLANVRLACALRAERPDFGFTLFPQGKIEPTSKRPLEFQGGLGHFLRALAPVTLVPVAIDFGFLKSLRPHLFVACGEPIVCDAELPEVFALEREATALLDGLQAELASAGENFRGFREGPLHASTLTRAGAGPAPRRTDFEDSGPWPDMPDIREKRA